DNGRTTNPGRLVKLLGEQACSAGAKFIQGNVSEFLFEGDRVRSICIDGKFQPVDTLMIAAGAPSGKLTRQLKTKIPIEAERGYHIAIPESNVMPRIPVTNVDAKFAASPMDVGLRLAGTVEYAGIEAPPNWKRTALLEVQAKRMFPGLALENVKHWVGD